MKVPDKVLYAWRIISALRFYIYVVRDIWHGGEFLLHRGECYTAEAIYVPFPPYREYWWSPLVIYDDIVFGKSKLTIGVAYGTNAYESMVGKWHNLVCSGEVRG